MAISVGPTIFAIIRYSINHSYRAGLAFVLGVSLSDILYVTVANLMAPLMNMLSKYDTWLAYGSSAILIIMGLAGLLKKEIPTRPANEPVTLSGGHYFRIWLSGFLINTINPGVVINWLAAVKIVSKTTEGYTPYQDTVYRIIFFGTCLLLVLGIDFLKVFLADKIRGWLTLRRIMILNKISAACLLAIGVAIFLFTILDVELGEKKPEPVAIHSVGCLRQLNHA
jgi:threonine/homoserine/homoserine lactone efflux protein